jgi:hydrogenase maturation protease
MARLKSLRVLVAGIGNRLMGDDGFGPRVVDILSSMELPTGVEARDFGTAGLTVATELENYDVAIFVDSIESLDEPGTLVKTEISVEGGIEDAGELARLTLHEVGLEGLLKFSKSIGTIPGRLYLVGCVPKVVEPSLDLSPEVETSIVKAASMTIEIINGLKKKKKLGLNG